MSLHQNDGTVITVTALDTAPDRWQQIEENAEAWYYLGHLGGGSVGGQQYTRQQCYIKALEVNAQHAEAWYYLGNMGGGSVGGQQYTQQQCYIKALEIDDQHVHAWWGLACCGGGNVGGQQYTKQQCDDKYNELSPLDEYGF